MDEWIVRLAGELGEEPPTGPETARLLGVARDVAHRVERRVTPLAAFLVGSAVGRATAHGATREEALARAIATLEAILPEAPAEG
jgi:hypothetical protein